MKSSLKKISGLLTLVILNLGIFAQDVSVNSVFDTSSIYIGDQIYYKIIVDQPSGMNLTLPSFKDTLCRNIEILEGPQSDTTEINGERIQIIEKYLITSFDSGHYRINPVFAEWKDETGIKRFYSGYAFLKVRRVQITPPDTVSKIFDIIGPYKAPVTFDEVLPWILLLLVIAALSWLIVRMAGKLKGKKSAVELPVIKDPPHVIALRELEKLKEEKLWQKGETKKYYTRLTEILRKYLEVRFGIDSLEMTTSETLDALVRSGFKKDESYNRLKSVLNGADLVKFAKYRPEPSENELSFELSWDFVTGTKQEPTADEEQKMDNVKEDKV